MVTLIKSAKPVASAAIDNALIKSIVDSNLSDYLSIVVTDAAGYVQYKAKAGDHRFLDVDDSDNSDSFQITADDAGGGVLQKSSRITDGNIWEIDHNGTMAGASASATIYQIVLDAANVAINDGAANACYLQGLRLEWGSITATAVTLSELVGIDITMPTTGAYNAEYGIYVKADKGDAANGAVPFLLSRDISAAITADRAYGDYAAQLTQTGANTSAGDFDLSDTATSGILKLVMSHTAATTVGAKTDPDVCQGKALYIECTGTTNNANTKLDYYPRAIDIVYTLTETLGELRMAATDIFRITPTIPNGLSSAGAFQFDIAEFNLDSVILNDANITMNGLYIDGSGLTNTSSAEANFINLVCPDDSNITQAIKIIADTTTANSTKIISSSRDINGTVAGAVALTNYANIFGQAVNHADGDFIITQTASTAGILDLVMAHTVSLATTAPDVFASTALNIDIDALVDTDVGADLDVSARAVDISYTLTETLGVLRLAETDIFRILATIPDGITSAGAYQLDMLELNADAVTLNDGNVTFNGLLIDWSGFTNTSSAAATMLHIIAPDDSNINNAVNISCDIADADLSQSALMITRDLNATITADRAISEFAASISSQNQNSSAGDFDLTDATTSGVLRLNYSHTAVTTAGAKTDPDLMRGSALLIDIDAVTNNANTKLDASPRAIDISYTLTETLGELRLAATDIMRILATIPTGVTSAGAYQFDMFELNGDAIVVEDANMTFTNINIDNSAMTLTAGTGAYGAKIQMPTSVGVAINRAAVWSSDGSNSCYLSNGSMGVSATGINEEKYCKIEDFDEEAAAVTLAAGLRGDEWVRGGVNDADANSTYIQDQCGVLQIVTNGADDDSHEITWLGTTVNTGSNPILEFRVMIDAVTANLSGFFVGVTETRDIQTINDISAVSDDYFVVGMNSDLATPADLRCWAEDNNGGQVLTQLTGTAIAANTWCTIRIDLTDTEQPRVFVNTTGGAITPAHEIVAATITQTIQDNIYVMPVIFVQCLDATPTARTLKIDYVKIWQDRS